jgi:hypothetical protein
MGRISRYMVGSLAVMAVVAGCTGKQLDAGGLSADFAAGGGGPDAPIIVALVLAPTVPSDGACTYTADPTQASLSTGNVDVGFGTLVTYTPALLVENRASSQVLINGAITKITDLAGDDLVTMLASMCEGTSTGGRDEAACMTGQQLGLGLSTPVNPFSTVESGMVVGGSSSVPSYGVLSVTIVDGETVDIMRTYLTNSLQLNGAAAFQTSIQLLTYTIVEGTQVGGGAVSSNVFEFPVTFAFGGLVSNLKADPNSAVGECLDTSSPPTAALTCVDGQDVAAYATSIPNVPDCDDMADAGDSVVGDDAG